MTPKQQRQPTDAHETFGDSLEAIIAHEIDLLFNKAPEIKQGFIDQAASQDVQLADSYVDELYNQLEIRVGERIIKHATMEQLEEIRSLSEPWNEIAILRLLDQIVPNRDEIVLEEINKTLRFIYQLSLQKRAQDATDKRIMEVSAERIIEQAEAAVTQPPQQIPRPEPNTQDTLLATWHEAYHLANVVAELRQRNIPLSTAEVEATVTGLQEISERTGRVARELGLYAVQHDLMPKTKLAKLLKVSKMTITRWTRGKPEQPDSPQT